MSRAFPGVRALSNWGWIFTVAQAGRNYHHRLPFPGVPALSRGLLISSPGRLPSVCRGVRHPESGELVFKTQDEEQIGGRHGWRCLSQERRERRPGPGLDVRAGWS